MCIEYHIYVHYFGVIAAIMSKIFGECTCMSIATEDVADWDTGDQKPSDDDLLTMIDHAEGEQDSRPNNKPEDLLELIMTADELQKPEESPKKSSNISPQNETKLSQQTNQPPTDKPTECKHNICCMNHIDRIAIKRYILSAGLEAANCKWCDHAW